MKLDKIIEFAKEAQDNLWFDDARRIVGFMGDVRKIPEIATVPTAIVFHSLEFWARQCSEKEFFYKFITPSPKNEFYRKGDSILEQCYLSEDEVRSAFGNIITSYPSYTAYKEVLDSGEDVFKGKFYLTYNDRLKHLLYFKRNNSLLSVVKTALYKGQIFELYDNIPAEKKENYNGFNFKGATLKQSILSLCRNGLWSVAEVGNVGFGEKSMSGSYINISNIHNKPTIVTKELDCEKQIFSPPLSIFSEKGTKIETPSETSEKTISLNTKKSHAQNSTRPDACLNTEKKAKEKKYADKHNLQKEFMEMYFEAHEKFKGIKPPQKDMGRIAKSLNELRLAIEEVVDRSYSEKGLLVDTELMKKKLAGFLLASYEKMDDFTKRQWDANYINSKFANIYAILVGAVPQKTTKGFYQQSAPATFSELQDKQFQKDFLIAILKSINVIFYGSAVKGKTAGIRVGKETLTSNRQVIDKLNEDGFIVDNQFAQIIKQNLIDSNCEIDYNSTHIANFCSNYNIDIDSFKGGL